MSGGIHIGVDFGSGDQTTIAILRSRPPEFAPVRTGDVEQMIADIDRVQLTRRSEEPKFDEVAAAIERELEMDLLRSINLMMFYW